MMKSRFDFVGIIFLILLVLVTCFFSFENLLNFLIFDCTPKILGGMLFLKAF